MEATALKPGDVVDRYTVEGLIGEGGMAMVFRVRHAALGTVHALKVLTLASPSIRARLQREGQLQAALRHPNIVAVTDVVALADGTGALVLELVDGPALDSVLRARRLTLEEVDLLVPGILAGVAAAHDAGYVHRDLKPANVLLARTGTGLMPKVADFGLAKVVAGSDAGTAGAHTRTGSAMGTPQYMSPEQIRDTKNVGPASDVFALGCILYELVTGQRAFDAGNLLDIFNAVARDEPVPVRTLAPDAPDRVVRAIEAALRKDPAARPTVAQLAQLWGANLDSVHSVALALPQLSVDNAPRTPETWRSAPEAPAAAPTPRSLPRAVWALGLGGTLALLVGLGVVAGVGLAAGGYWWLGGARVVTVPVVVGADRPDPAPGPDPEEVVLQDVVRDEPIAELQDAPAAPPAELAPPAAPPADVEADAAEADAAPVEDAEELRAPAVPAPPPAPAPRARQVPEAFGMLASDDPDDRIVAAENLARRIADPDAPARLGALVRADADPAVRRVAASLAVALYLDGHRDLEPAIVWLMANGPEPAALAAVDAYRAKGADPRDLAGALRHPVARVQVAALRALPVVRPRTPDAVHVDYEALLRPLVAPEQPPAVRRLAAELLRGE
ncbi:MAG: protein kinase [Myxococcota bacterium]